MKIKFVCFCAGLVLLTTAASAQKVRLQGGVNLANISVNDNGRVDESKSLTSFQAGLVFDVPLALNTLYLQPGVIFTGKGTEAESGDQNSATYFRATSNPYYIEVPVNLVFKTPAVSSTRFFVGAGPYLAVGVAGKNKVEGKYLGVGFNSEEDIRFSDDDPTTFDYEEGAGFGVLKRFDYGLNGTAGIEGKSFVLSVNYGLGLAKLQSGTNDANSDDNNNKHRVLSFTLGFKL